MQKVMKTIVVFFLVVIHSGVFSPELRAEPFERLYESIEETTGYINDLMVKNNIPIENGKSLLREGGEEDPLYITFALERPDQVGSITDLKYKLEKHLTARKIYQTTFNAGENRSNVAAISFTNKEDALEALRIRKTFSKILNKEDEILVYYAGHSSDWKNINARSISVYLPIGKSRNLGINGNQ
ncbi:MAG: hypothetical protein ACPGOY_17715 [Rhodospirillaceae bacterium]